MTRLTSVLNALPEEGIVLLISGFPFVELRGALPLAVSVYDLPFADALVLCMIGNLLPVPPLLLLFRPLSGWMRRFGWYRRFYDWLYDRTMKKSRNVEKYGALGLVLFTAVPLPTTGAWSACIAASLFEIPFKYAFPAIAAGVGLAALGIGIFSESLLN